MDEKHCTVGLSGFYHSNCNSFPIANIVEVYDTMKLRDIVIRFGERYLSAPEIDEINSHVYVNIRNKRVTLFSLTIVPLVRAKDEISKLDQLCGGKSCSFRRTDGPIEDPRRLDRIGPFCGPVERSVLSVLSTFGHASMMSTGIA